MSSLNHQLIRKSTLSEQDITSMYQLMESFYENITPKEFLRTLAKKDYVFLLKEQFGNIQAFTTLQIIHIPVKKQVIPAILAGDIITHKDYAEERNIFAEAFLDYQRCQKKHRERYVFLTCKDYYTFETFKQSFRNCYPNATDETPVQMRKLINAFGDYYFGQDYELATGLIKHTCFPRKIKESRILTVERKMNEEKCDFFLSRNPEYQKGYDLVCVAELSEENELFSIHNINPMVNVR